MTVPQEKSQIVKKKEKLILFSTFEISTVLRKNKNCMGLVLRKWSQCEYSMNSEGPIHLH